MNSGPSAWEWSLACSSSSAATSSAGTLVMNEAPALPELPEPVNPVRHDDEISGEYRITPDYTDLYAADQLRSYALQERAAERERCAKVCEENAVAIGIFCAAAIRKGDHE